MTHQLSPARRQTSARAAVLIATVLWLAGVAAVVTSNDLDWRILTAMTGFFLSWIAARVLIGDIAERPVSEVDEYELHQRNRARNVGYLMSQATLVGLFVVLSVAVGMSDNGERELLQRTPELAFSGILLAFATPTLYLAWQVRGESDPTNESEFE